MARVGSVTLTRGPHQLEIVRAEATSNRATARTRPTTRSSWRPMSDRAARRPSRRHPRVRSAAVTSTGSRSSRAVSPPAPGATLRAARATRTTLGCLKRRRRREQLLHGLPRPPSAIARDRPRLQRGGHGRPRSCTAIQRDAPDFDVLVVDDGSTDATAAARARRPARGARAIPFNLGIGGAMQSGYQLRARAAATTSPSRSTATASTTRRDRRAARSAMRRATASTWSPGSRFLEQTPATARRSRRRARDPALRGRAVGDLRPAGHRPDLGLPDLQPPRDRAVRARLPARLPRGRGDPDGARPPPARCARCRCGCAPRRTARSSITLGAVGLLHGQGAARDLRRPVPRAARSLEPGAEAPVAAERGI